MVETNSQIGVCFSPNLFWCTCILNET